MRHMFITYRCRMQSDHRTFGELFYACCDELSDISFVEALYRLMSLASEQLRKMGSFCEKTAKLFFDVSYSIPQVDSSRNVMNYSVISRLDCCRFAFFCDRRRLVAIARTRFFISFVRTNLRSALGSDTLSVSNS